MSELYSAAEAGDLVEVQRLLGAGADPSAGDWSGWTPLHAAAERGDTTVVAALLEAGARPDLATETAHTPLHLAASGGHAATCGLSHPVHFYYIHTQSTTNVSEAPYCVYSSLFVCTALIVILIFFNISMI